MKFQFTHPGRGATGNEQDHLQDRRVSIHAPREGCDRTTHLHLILLHGFQFTHPGRGATSTTFLASSMLSEFQFTHPGRGATS